MQAVCSQPWYREEEEYFGGPPFDLSDPATYWCEPSQLYTWWKNNIERRSKFKVLVNDAFYNGFDGRRTSRFVIIENYAC